MDATAATIGSTAAVPVVADRRGGRPPPFEGSVRITPVFRSPVSSGVRIRVERGPVRFLIRILTIAPTDARTRPNRIPETGRNIGGHLYTPVPDVYRRIIVYKYCIDFIYIWHLIRTQSALTDVGDTTVFHTSRALFP